MATKSNIARYENIAYQIATRIYNGDIKENSKMSGRTLLSSEYNVSSETIRRAIRSLVNYDVVMVKNQSGIYVVSSENAKKFLDDFEQKNKQKNIKRELMDLIEEEVKIHQKMDRAVKNLLKSKELFPFDYFSIKIKPRMTHINKSIKDLKFYSETGGLIIAYEVNQILYQVPKPDTVIEEDMILHIMGDLTIKKKVEDFFEISKE